MSDNVLKALYPALNLVVLERHEYGAFQLLTPATPWLTNAFVEAAAGGRHALAGAFPFLDDFLQQAEGAWKAGPHASLVSGPFATTVAEDELLLRASALTVDGRALLVLERLVGIADSRAMLRKARERMLEGEKLTRQAARVHAPASAIAEAVAALAKTTVSDEQRGPIDRLTAASTALTNTVADLPTPPAKTRKS